MRIAICDHQIFECVEALLKKYAPKIQTVRFDSMKSLLEGSKQDFFPLIFLGIEQESVERLEQAKQLLSGEQKPLILLVSETNFCAVDAYGIAFRYLIKPIDEKKFQTDLTEALRILNPKNITLVDDYGRVFYIALQDVLYFECRNYVVFAHTVNGVCTIRTRLKNIEMMLEGSNFYRIHTSFLINLDYVSNLLKDDVEMKDGMHIGISRSRKKEFISIFLNRMQKSQA